MLDEVFAEPTGLPWYSLAIPFLKSFRDEARSFPSSALASMIFLHHFDQAFASLLAFALADGGREADDGRWLRVDEVRSGPCSAMAAE
jgi:hypothetical protein